ncbi:MAG: hypothetical protein ACJAYX_000766 [Planctomycetota bacterium]|jgi:hypothetical protein
MSEQPENDAQEGGATNTPGGDPTSPQLATTTAAASADEGAKKAPKSKKAKQNKAAKPKSRWWWRWTKRLAITGLVARILLWLFLEQITNFGAGYAGLAVSWRSASLSITGLSLHIEDLVVRDANDADAPALLKAQEVVADLSMRQLLSGQVSIVDAGIAGGRVSLHRNADGTLRLPKSWTEPAAVTLPEPEQEETAPDEPISFELPCWIASTRLHDLQFDFFDESVSPARHHTGKLDLDIADIGFPDRNGSIMLRVHAPQLCDELFVHTRVQAMASKVDVNFQAAVRGFRPHRFGLAQQLLDIIENAHVVDVRLGGDLNATILPSAPKHPALAGGFDFGLSLDGIERSTITSKFGPTEVTGVGTVDVGVVTPFSLAMNADGIVAALRLEAGRLELAESRTAITADLRGEGLTCLRIRPILAASGISLPDNGIDLDASMDAEFGDSMSVDLSRIAIRDGDQELLALKRLAVRDVRTNDDTLAIGSVEIVGPFLPIRHEADGSIRLAGLHIKPTTSNQPATAETALASGQPATTEAFALPKIRLGSFDWSGTQLVYTDASIEPAASLTIGNLHLHGDGITIGEAAQVPGRMMLSFSVPDVAKRCTADLTLKSREDGIYTDLQWLTDGITLQGLRPWLTPLGIESELDNGKFQLAANADLNFTEQGITGSAHLVNVQFIDGANKLLTLRSVDGEDIRIANSETHIGTWTVRDPFVKVHRDQEQLLHALGLKLGNAPPSEAGANATTANATSTTPPAAPTAPPTSATTPASTAAPLTHGKLIVDRTTLAWSDARFPDRTFSIGLDAAIGATTADEGLPIDITLRLDRAMRACGIRAVLRQDSTRNALVGNLTATGIEGNELELLLPEGMRCTLVNGALNADFDARIDLGDSSAMRASVRELRLVDRDTEVAAIDEILLDVPAFTDDEVHIRDAHVTGIRAIVTLTPDALHVPGFSFAQTAKTAVPAPSAAPATPATSKPATITPQPPLILPKLRIDALALELERLELRDRRGDTAEPLVLKTGLRLLEPWFGDPTADEPNAMSLEVSGNCQPLGATFKADTTLSLFDLTPTLDIDFSLNGFDTTQLQRVMPSLAKHVRGEATALSATAKLHAFLNMKRRDPSKFDFNRSLGAELTLENLVVRDANSEEPYASIASIDAIVRAIQPSTGSVLLRSLTIDDPQLRIEKDQDGMHIAGFLLPTPPVDEVAAGAPNDTTPTVEPSKPAKASVPTAPSAGEFAIDRFDLLGLNVEFKDATTDPPTHLSLMDTDAQIRRFSTRAFTEPRAMSFSIAVRGGPVPLEQRVIKSSVLAGLLTSGAEALIGANQDHEYEQRAMLDELTVKGQLQLFPTTIGRINISLTELELASFRGLAKQAGVDLTDGLYDMRVGVDLKGYDGIDIRSNHVLTYLALDEPPDGPIYRYLRLPAPIQTVLFLLRNADDQQRLPISLHVPADGVSQGTIVSLAVENLIKLIGDAASSAGERVIGGASGGLLGGSSDIPDIAVEVPFANGSPLPSGHDLQPLIEAALADETLSIVLTHEMGAGDQQRAYQLANPDADVVGATIARLQQKRTELEAQRIPLAADVVALYAAGKSQEALRSQEQLHNIDNHQGELLTALNKAIYQIGNPSKRNALRRTRGAALALAEARLDAVSKELADGCPQLLRTASTDSVARIERRPGRGLPIAGLPKGGRVVAVLRRRAAQELPSKRPQRKPGQTPSVMSSGFTAVPPVADPSNRAFNNR